MDLPTSAQLYERSRKAELELSNQLRLRVSMQSVENTTYEYALETANVAIRLAAQIGATADMLSRMQTAA